MGHLLPWENHINLNKNLVKLLEYHRPYHPQSSGKVEGTKILKSLNLLKLQYLIWET